MNILDREENLYKPRGVNVTTAKLGGDVMIPVCDDSLHRYVTILCTGV
jgi:hypothetical protein